MHVPLLHNGIDTSQTLPQAPQLLASVHVPPQFVSGQVHVPLLPIGADAGPAGCATLATSSSADDSAAPRLYAFKAIDHLVPSVLHGSPGSVAGAESVLDSFRCPAVPGHFQVVFVILGTAAGHFFL